MDRIVDQVVDRNIYTTYMPQIQLLVKEMLDIKDEAEGTIVCNAAILFLYRIVGILFTVMFKPTTVHDQSPTLCVKLPDIQFY